MIDLISQTWPWYVSGPLIALVMLSLLWTGKRFGVSSTLRTLCTIGGAGKKVSFFNFDWKSQRWNLVFVLGSVIGGYLAVTFLSSPEGLKLNPDTVKDLTSLGLEFNGSIVPEDIFSWTKVLSFKGILFILVGGLLVGFGARWAGGCTSGHAISGLSELQLPSLIAVIGFFIGGLAMTHLFFPLIF